MSTSLIEHFSRLEDPRIERHKIYPLIEIVFLSISAVLAGCEGWEAIVEFGKTKISWLRKFLPFSAGIPVDDTVARVMSRVSPKGLQNCFISWTQSVCEVTSGEVIPLDGKTVRRSFNRGSKQNAIHMVSAWASTNGVILGQVKTEEKSNEITAMPALLELLDVKGCLVTTDAMGCQTEIAKKIIDKGADYVLAVKGNQPHLYEDVRNYFKETDLSAVEKPVFHEEIDCGHGRIETRRYWACANLSCLRDASKWEGLESFVKVEALREVDGKKSVEHRFYISSLEADAKKLGNAIRMHWGIENKVHWVLDLTFREDESRIRRGDAAENMSVLRRLALNLLKQEASSQKSLKQKRMKAGWDDSYRERTLFGKEF